MKKIPIGIEDFREIKTECYYVDKTMILYDVFSRGESSTMLYTRPRRFGKSLTLSMMEYFFSDQYDSKALFADTEFIRNCPQYLGEMNTKSVVRIDLKSIYKKDYGSFLSSLSALMGKIYGRVFEHVDTGGLSKTESDYLRRAEASALNEGELELSLAYLLEFIHKCKGKKAFVLIDEYGAPYQASHEFGYFDDLRLFMKNFLGEALKGNPHLHKAVLTGVTPIAQTSVFSDLNQIVVNTLLGNREKEHFGFTLEESKAILSYFGYQGDFRPIKEWYGGYVFQNKSVFNPWSIINFIENNFDLRPYWVKTGTNRLIKDCIDLQGNDGSMELLNAIYENGLVTRLNESIDFDSSKETNTHVSLLVASGYLRAERQINSSEYYVSIPNQEVRYAFNEEIVGYAGKRKMLTHLNSLRRALLSQDYETIKEEFSNYFLSSFTYLDLKSENDYKLVFCTLLNAAFEDYVTSCEVNSGEGRVDVFMRSKGGFDFAFIFELKYLRGRRENARLKEAAERALSQIAKKKYFSEAKRLSYGNIYLFGMAFSGKNAYVAGEKLESQ